MSQGQVLQFPAECRLCGNVMRAGETAQGVSGGKGFIHMGDCPDPEQIRPVSSGKAVNLGQRVDAELLFWERTCLGCRCSFTGRMGTPIPKRCPVTTYSPTGEPCGGEWVDAADYVAEDEPDERPEWLQKLWDRHRSPHVERVPDGEEDNVFRRALKDLRPVAGKDDDIPF